MRHECSSSSRAVCGPRFCRGASLGGGSVGPLHSVRSWNRMVLADFSDRCTRCVLEVESLCARGAPSVVLPYRLETCATGCVCHRGAVVCVNGPLDGRRNASGPASPETVTAVPVIDTAAWTFFRARGTQCLCWRWATRWVRLAVTRPGVRLGARRRCLRLGAWRGVLRWLHLPARCVRPRRSARRASSVRFGGRSLVGAALCAPVDGGASACAASGPRCAFGSVRRL